MIRSLKKAEKRLKTLCRSVGKTGATAAAAELREHYVMLSSALEGGVSALRRRASSDAAALWRACLELFDRGVEPTQQNLASFFASRPLGLWAAGALPAFLPAAFALRAVETFSTERTEGEPPFSRAIRGMFRLREIDHDALIPLICPAEQALCRDEAYRLSDVETKAAYRRAVIRLAASRGEAETDTVARLLASGRHIGFSLPLQKRRRGGAVFLVSEAILPLLLSAGLVFLLRAEISDLRFPALCAAMLALFLYLPLYAALKPAAEWLLRRLRQPYFLPSLDPDANVSLPKTLITVSNILPPAGEAAAFAAHLASLAASHSGSSAGVVALMDLKNASGPSLPADAADLAAMRREIDRLNAENGGGFLMAVRGRVFAPTENEYTGFERKRGAIEALVRLLRDGTDCFDALCGDRDVLNDAVYLLALDADTLLPFEELRKLLCVAAHPMNRAVLNAEKTALQSGYGCFAPRSEVSVSAAGKTFFSRVMTWGGVSAYSPRVSSRYMDLFGTSVFSGKGLIDADVYRALCVGAFPAGRVLSHDILEGSLLRTAFVSTCAFTEGFPASPASFFRRQSRWIRGDVQNLRFLIRPLGVEPGARLPALARFQLLDNALRAVLPVGCLGLILASLLFPSKLSLCLLITGVLGRASGELSAALSVFLRQGAFGFSRAYFSACLSSGMRALMRAVLSAGLLPYEAAVSADACCRALWRTLVSGRKTLEWTTAAQSEGRGGAPVLCAAAFPLLCAGCLLFGRAYHLPVAALFAGTVPFALSKGGLAKKTEKRAPTAGEAESLTQYAAAMWRYFEEYAGEEDHFLPPDNVQETPVRRVAHRTSPTNIGLYLTCVLAAADLSLITPAQLSDRLSKSLDSLFSLPRCHGLLYNWYDTRTLRPLSPAFVSSVDCGNYLACLTALREGLREYVSLGLSFRVLIGSIGAELDRARLDALYVPGRRLFSVGLNVSAGKLSDSYYDSYMSEARLASYYAVARRQAPASHWAALDRSFLRRGRSAAAASYGGTAFEYFMPALFLPLYENTYAAEGLESCLYEQKRRAKGVRPWGVSESAFYAFDASLNYRYRAHGLKGLALREDPNDQPVFAPYACFLALPLDLRGALSNLRRFASLGAYGACGFYEAVDFSAGDTGEDYMIVRSYMAHHVGMSMLACVNALRGSVFVRRFMRDPAMAGAASLLMEKIPADAPVYRPPRFSVPKKRLPERRVPPPAAAFTHAAAYSNGEATLICDEKGRNYFLYGGRSLFSYSQRAFGLCAAVRAGKDYILPAAGEASLLPTGFLASCEAEGLRAQYALALVDRVSALAAPVKLKNKTKTAVRAEICFYFEPQAEPLFFASEHPAFSDMCVRIEYVSALNALVFHRVERGNDPVWFSVGFSDFSPFTFACDRETLLGTLPRETPFGALPNVFSNETCFTFPAAAIRTEVNLSPGASAEKVLLACPAATREGALESLSRLRSGRLPDLRKAVLSPFPAVSASIAERFLRTVFFGCADPDIAAAAARNTAPANALWEKGISGDLPVLRVRTDGLPQEIVAGVLRFYRALRFSGIPADLVLLTESAAEYGGDAAAALESLLARENLTSRRDVSGGVRVLFSESCSKAFLGALAACPGLGFPFEKPLEIAPEPPRYLVSSPLFGGENTFVPNGFFIGKRPPRPWCHTLSNPAFGTLLGFGSLGFTWALDSRLNQLTPWHNDPCTPFPGETLLYISEGGAYDCLSGASVYFLDHAAVYGADCGGAQLRVTVRVDAKAMKKQVRVQFRGAGGRVVYRIVPRMCGGEKQSFYVRGEAERGLLRFTNPANTDFGGYMCLYADRTGAASYAEGAGALQVPLREGKDEVCFYMAYAANESALDALCALPFRPSHPRRARPALEAPEVSRFAGALLLHGVYDTRVLARTGFFQNSGAYGFRDQLQDTMNIASVCPETARRQILRCAAAQFPEGDVLHWFHVVTRPSPHLKGVRTLCADDALWLPAAVCRYVELTGDEELLNVPVPFLEGEPLSEGERERYADYDRGKTARSVYLHCVCALKNAFRSGPHGLPLMRGGDWNDSFNELGLQGESESVWLGMFLSLVCERFAHCARLRRDDETEDALRLISADLKEKILRHAYNGAWFLRGFCGNGAPLGDRGCPACEIDLLPQAFAVFSGIADAETRRRALLAAWERLWDPTYKTLRLFYPPFGKKGPRAGYVNDYPAGVRENAGQYTHAAVWFALALRKEGLTEPYRALLPALLPNLRYQDPALAARFLNEPYAVTADICMSPGLEGRGGWSLYTGAAGWLWRMLNEEAEDPR
ncbi:MAG: DUF3131 domain-containing protein [Clostridia bacterium]|nr:DUF3131 domain-containing protein [Clostridia bacterium]